MPDQTKLRNLCILFLKQGTLHIMTGHVVFWISRGSKRLTTSIPGTSSNGLNPRRIGQFNQFTTNEYRVICWPKDLGKHLGRILFRWHPKKIVFEEHDILLDAYDRIRLEKARNMDARGLPRYWKDPLASAMLVTRSKANQQEQINIAEGLAKAGEKLNKGVRFADAMDFVTFVHNSQRLAELVLEARDLKKK